MFPIRNKRQGTFSVVPFAPTDLDRKVAAFLKKQRGTMTYREFAKRIGLNASTIFRLEQCEQSITVGRLHGVLKKLKLSPRDVFE